MGQQRCACAPAGRAVARPAAAYLACIGRPGQRSAPKWSARPDCSRVGARVKPTPHVATAVPPTRRVFGLTVVIRPEVVAVRTGGGVPVPGSKTPRPLCGRDQGAGDPQERCLGRFLPDHSRAPEPFRIEDDVFPFPALGMTGNELAAAADRHFIDIAPDPVVLMSLCDRVGTVVGIVAHERLGRYLGAGLITRVERRRRQGTHGCQIAMQPFPDRLAVAPQPVALAFAASPQQTRPRRPSSQFDGLLTTGVIAHRARPKPSNRGKGVSQGAATGIARRGGCRIWP